MTEPEWEVPTAEDFAWARSGAAEQSQAPAVDLPHTEGQHDQHREHLKHMGLDAVHVASTIAELYEMFHVSGLGLAGHGGVIAGSAAVLAPMGGIAVGVLTAMELKRAFTTTQRIEAQKGVTYGLMWGVLGVPDVPHSTRPGPFGGDLPLTPSEQEAWQKGVEEGREMAKDPKVRETIERALAYEMAVQKRDLATDPQHRAWHVAVDNTLNRVWEEVHEKQVRWGEQGLNESKLPWVGGQDGFPKPAPKP
jgi:hypothetical protein